MSETDHITITLHPVWVKSGSHTHYLEHNVLGCLGRVWKSSQVYWQTRHFRGSGCSTIDEAKAALIAVLNGDTP